MRDHLRLDRIEPRAFGFAPVGQQPVAFAQGRFIAGRMAGMRGVERQRQAVHIPPPIAGRPGEQAVHRRRQPGHRQPFAEPRRAAFRAIDPHPAAARIGAFGIGAEAHRPILLPQVGADAEASSAALAHHVGQRGTAQAASGRKQRKRLEDIGLARPVLAHQQVELRGLAQLGRGVVAEVDE